MTDTTTHHSEGKSVGELRRLLGNLAAGAELLPVSRDAMYAALDELEALRKEKASYRWERMEAGINVAVRAAVKAFEAKLDEGLEGLGVCP